MNGPGPKMFFALDSQSKPGKCICHFVQFDTVVFDNDETFDKAEFKAIHPENDKRLNLFAGCLPKGK
ncbi:MAG: hypothetical protein Q7Q73_02585 [Verrucomicrobiota bacterium JB024]|nr:hypothetical protein [Verrucomicrobiota bacterium JB024]